MELNSGEKGIKKNGVEWKAVSICCATLLTKQVSLEGPGTLLAYPQLGLRKKDKIAAELLLQKHKIEELVEEGGLISNSGAIFNYQVHTTHIEKKSTDIFGKGGHLNQWIYMQNSTAKYLQKTIILKNPISMFNFAQGSVPNFMACGL